MKKIAILATGGTIAGKGTAGATHGYKPGKIGIDEMLDSVIGIRDLAEMTGFQLYNVPSDNMTEEHLATIALKIGELAEEYDGFVITHGTDTLEETAYYLQLTVKTPKPVVLVGSMRPFTARSADGSQNLYQAVCTAANDQSVGKGVLVVLADSIYSARTVVKTNSFKTEGFSGKDFGCIGYVRDNRVEYMQVITKAHTVDTPFYPTLDKALPKVAIGYFHLDADVALLTYMIEHHDGIVIAGAGNGGMHKGWIELLKEEEYSNKFVVIASRTGAGSVIAHPELPSNCISSGTLNPQKARILLQQAISITQNPEEIKFIFEKY